MLCIIFLLPLSLSAGLLWKAACTLWAGHRVASYLIYLLMISFFFFLVEFDFYPGKPDFLFDSSSGGRFIYRMPFLSDWNDDL